MTARTNNLSHDPDVTVVGGFGGYARGWDEVSQNTDFAASRFRGARSFGIKLLAHGASSDLGYAVWIEHGEVRVEGRDDFVLVVAVEAATSWTYRHP